MVVGPAVALGAGGLIAVVLFFCAFGILKQVSSRDQSLPKHIQILPSSSKSPRSDFVDWNPRPYAWPRSEGSQQRTPSLVPASPISPVSPEYSDALPEYMNPHPLLAVQGSSGMEAEAREWSSINDNLSQNLRAVNGASQQSSVFPGYLNHQPLLPLDQLSTAPSDSGELPSADDSLWPYPSRDTGTGENWSIGTTSFIFSPSNFFVSGDTVPDTVFDDRSGPASYLGRWCQGASRVLSWVGETGDLLEPVQDEELHVRNKDAEDTDEEGYSERNIAETVDSAAGRNPPGNYAVLEPDVSSEELPLSCSPFYDFDDSDVEEDGFDCGGGSCEDCETFLQSIDGCNLPFADPDESCPSPQSRGQPVPQLKIQTCPADFGNDTTLLFPDPPPAQLRRNRSLSTIYEDPDESPLISITIQCLESIVEPPKKPGTELQIAGEVQDSAIPSREHSMDCGDISSEKTEGERRADTSSICPSQEVSMQQIVGHTKNLDNHANRNPFRRVTCQVCYEPEHVEYNPCFRQKTQDSEESSSACSLSSLGDIDLYLPSADSEGSIQSPMWVDNCLFDKTMIQNPSKKNTKQMQLWPPARNG